MAMNPTWLSRRLTTLVLLLTAVALIPPERYGAVARPQPPVPPPGNPFQRSVQALGRQLVQAQTELYFAERADEALAAEPKSPGPAIAVTPDFPSGLADYLVPRLADHWTQLGGRADVRIAAHLALDTAGYAGVWRDSLRLRDPQGLNGPVRNPIRRVDWRVHPTISPHGASCVIAITIGQWEASRANRISSADAAFFLRPRRSINAPPGLGPCGFLAAFGAPGRHVGAWLDSTDYTFARVADWSARHTPSPDSIRSFPTYFGRRNIDVRACSAGRLARCRTALLRAPWSKFYPRTRSELYAEGWYGFNHDFASFAEHAPYLLSDLAHDVGPEAFGRFWRSDLPLEEAFREATGRDLIEWTAAWAQEYVGVPPHSPRVGEVTLVLSLVAAGLAVGLAAVVNQKRGG